MTWGQLLPRPTRLPRHRAGPRGTEAPAAGWEGRGLQGSRQDRAGLQGRGRSVRAFLEVKNITVTRVVTTGLRSIPSAMELVEAVLVQRRIPRSQALKSERRGETGGVRQGNATIAQRGHQTEWHTQATPPHPGQVQTSRESWTAPNSHRRTRRPPSALGGPTG